MASTSTAALPAPRTEIDALPYVDSQYNNPAVKRQVDALVEAELKTFAPRDYLEHLPLREPDFEAHPILQSEWLRVCAEQPMPQMDTSRYQLDPPPANKQSSVPAWERAVANAQAQLEHQSTRLENLELLQKHGANLWRVHLNALEAANGRLEGEQAELVAQIAELNRKRKADQVEVGPKLARLESDWVNAVKKNLQIEGHVSVMKAECEAMRQQLDRPTPG